MTTATNIASLVKLSETNLVLEDSSQDVRAQGRRQERGEDRRDRGSADRQSAAKGALPAGVGGWLRRPPSRQAAVPDPRRRDHLHRQRQSLHRPDGRADSGGGGLRSNVVSEQTYWEELYGRYGYARIGCAVTATRRIPTTTTATGGARAEACHSPQTSVRGEWQAAEPRQAGGERSLPARLPGLALELPTQAPSTEPVSGRLSAAVWRPAESA